MNSVYFHESFFRYKPLNIINCNQSIDRYFIDAPLSAITNCLEMSNLALYGNFYSLKDPGQLIQISADFDLNKFENQTNSTSNSVIYYIYLSFPISSIDQNNFETPYTFDMGQNYLYVGYNDLNYYFMTMQLIEIYTNEGLIFDSWRTDRILTSSYKNDLWI